MNLGMGELVVIFAIVLLIVGARRLPDLGRSIGQAIREFQGAVRGKPRDDDQPSEKR
jgi:sec-independent protein translocase protein TatA